MFDWAYGFNWYCWIGFNVGIFLMLLGFAALVVTRNGDYIICILLAAIVFVVPIICGGQFETTEKEYYSKWTLSDAQKCEIAEAIENNGDIRGISLGSSTVTFNLRKNDVRFLDDIIDNLSFDLYTYKEMVKLADEKMITDCVESGGKWFGKLDRCLECGE